MKTTILVAAIMFAATSAQADIMCGRLGCYESGKTIRLNGGAYLNLGHTKRPETKDELEGRARMPKQQLRPVPGTGF